MPLPRPRLPRPVGAGILALALVVAVAPAAATARRTVSPNTVAWSGGTWTVKTSSGAVGPGPCVFASAGVVVDLSGRLHLKIQKNAAGAWTCAEVIAPASLGYGTYTFTVTSRVDAFDPNVVLGLFTWSDKSAYAHREIDVELARWGDAADPTNAQYVVQPFDLPSHLVRFTQPATSSSTQSFTWRAGRIDWRSVDLATGATIASYSYTGADVPVPGDERVHLNLWLYTGAAPSNGLPAEAVVSSFAYTP